MKILHIVQRYSPARGGAETHLAEISKYLAAQGHEVTVATTDALDFELFWDPDRKRGGQFESWEGGVYVRRFPVRHVLMPKLGYAAIRRLLWVCSLSRVVPVKMMHQLARYTPYVPGLWSWLAETNEAFDLAAGMTITFESLMYAGLRFARCRRIPYVAYPLTHLGAGAKPGGDSLGRFYTMRHQVDLVCKSDGVLVQTDDERDFYWQQGAHKERFVIAGPGVTPIEVLGGDGASFRECYQIKEPIVLYVGSMSLDKGAVHTVEAVRRLRHAGTNVALVMIGAILTPFERYLEGLPAVVRARIHVLGAVDDGIKRDALAACDVFSMPSRTDSFGISYLEAWLYGKPVIGAKTWGIRNVISEGKDGFLVPFGDVPALTERLALLLNNLELRLEMGERGRIKVYAEHTWDKKVVLSESLYTSLVEQAQGAG